MTNLANIATGIVNGDGFFPGHWANPGTGIMDPVRSPFLGQIAQISSIDVSAIDIIGWDVLPEQSTLTLFASGTLILCRRSLAR